MPHHRLAKWTRIVGILVISCAAVLFVTQAYALMHTTPANVLDYAARALAYLVLGIGVGSALVAISGIVETRVDPSGAFLATLQQLQQQVDQLNMRVGSLAANAEIDRGQPSIAQS